MTQKTLLIEGIFTRKETGGSQEKHYDTPKV